MTPAPPPHPNKNIVLYLSSSTPTPPHPILFHLKQLSAVIFWCTRMCVRAYVCVCVYVNIFSETTGPTEAKFHVQPLWDKGRKFIQMVQVICSSLLSTSVGQGTFSKDFTINLSPQCRALSKPLKTEKLKAPLFPGPSWHLIELPHDKTNKIACAPSPV